MLGTPCLSGLSRTRPFAVGRPDQDELIHQLVVSATQRRGLVLSRVAEGDERSELALYKTGPRCSPSGPFLPFLRVVFHPQILLKSHLREVVGGILAVQLARELTLNGPR